MKMIQLDLLPTDLIRSALRETVEEKLKSSEYEINVSPACKVGEDNFMGDVYRASYNKKSAFEGKDNKNQIHKMIIKTAKQDIVRRHRCLSGPCFQREIHMYEKVLPAFRRFEQSKGVAPENGFNNYPNCYRSVKTEPSESLFLEDLSVHNFVMLDRFTKDITVEHVLLLMKSVGKFHAISFAMKDQQVTQLKELTSPMNEVLLAKRDDKRWDHLVEQFMDLEKVLCRKEDAHLLARIKNLSGVENVSVNCINPEITGCAVITHGDLWQNNLLFRYDDSEKPIGISLLDWQLSRYSSAITDIVFSIFCCTTKELRDKHYDDFLNTYHASLSTHIRRLGSDPEKLFSYEMMQEQLHKFGRFGLFMAAIMIPFVTKEAGLEYDAAEINNPGPFFFSDNSRSKFEKRMRDIIIDMIRLEYI